MGSNLAVTCIEGVAALERFREDIARLNAGSERRNPFLSADFLLCYALRAEYHTPGREERLYVIREGEGGRIVGIAPMRATAEDVGPAVGPMHIQGTRLHVLAPLDTDRPGILASPEDESRVARALVDYLCTQDGRWGLLEFAGQLPGSPLHDALHSAAGRKFRTRDFQVEPYTEITITWPTLAAYFRSLVKKMRSNISRQARRLYASGTVQVVLATGSQPVGAWFDAYLDLDRRSWKGGTDSSIQRHPRRVRFYRELISGRAGFDPSFVGIVLDGVLTAGLIVGSNQTASPQRHGAWCLEMAYDEARADLGPGQLLLLFAMGEAMARGDQRLNFMQNFAYYKHRWGAELIPVVNVQLLRRVSLHNLRASLGEWTRKLKARRGVAHGPAPGDANSGYVEQQVAATGNSVIATAGNWHSSGGEAEAITAAALAYSGQGVRVLDRAAAQAYLPFDLEIEPEVTARR